MAEAVEEEVQDRVTRREWALRAERGAREADDLGINRRGDSREVATSELDEARRGRSRHEQVLWQRAEHHWALKLEKKLHELGVSGMCLGWEPMQVLRASMRRSHDNSVPAPEAWIVPREHHCKQLSKR